MQDLQSTSGNRGSKLDKLQNRFRDNSYVLMCSKEKNCKHAPGTTECNLLENSLFRYKLDLVWALRLRLVAGINFLNQKRDPLIFRISGPKFLNKKSGNILEVCWM